MSTCDWTKIGANYVFYGYRIRAIVYRDHDVWSNHIWIEGEGEIERGEWSDREAAIRNSNTGMQRLIWIRKFEKDPPMADIDDEDDPDDDDE